MTNFIITPQHILTALKNNEFVYYYQPKISLITGKVVGAEALIRWIKPDGTIIRPDHFIPLAEQHNIIQHITYQMFSKLARDILILSDINNELLISFNTNAKDFETIDFAVMVLDTLNKLHINPEKLQIEITETTVLNTNPNIKKHIQLLCNQNIGLLMDDYGIGYSSLDSLGQWPFTAIKLDKGIINRMLDSPKNRTIVESSIRMAHELEINTIAEGVETDLQYKILLEAGCTKAQGFWLSKPLPLDQFINFIKEDFRWSGLPVGLIHMAIVDHIQWRKKLITDIVHIASLPKNSRDCFINELSALEHYDCRLGQWYYGIGQYYKGYDYFDDIDEPHKKFHALGKQMVHIVSHNGSLTDLTPIMEEFSNYSIIILDLLQKLEQRGLLEMNSAHKEWQEYQLSTE